jgi:serine/threonine protein kinase
MKRIILKAQKNRKKSSIYSSDEYISDEDPDINLASHILNNRYICLFYLSKGGFSSVWVVYDTVDFDLKSAKVFNDNHEEFYNEKKILEQIITNDTKNIVRCYDIFEENSLMVIITELLGISLLDVINDIYENKYTLFVTNIKFMFRQIINGFRELHNIGIIHADIKPDNILLDILPHNITTLNSILKELNIKDLYITIFNSLVPQDYNTFNKNKKKMVKRKIKMRTIKGIRDYLFEKNIFTKFEKKHTENNIVMYNPKLIQEHRFNIKIIDFSNSEFEDNISQNEIYIRSYRPLENIININYTKKSEIWAIGCLFYECLTGINLFEIKKHVNETEKNIDHLYNIFKTFTNQNYKGIVENCDFYDNFFSHRKLKIKNKYEVLDLRQKLIHNSIIELDIDEMYNFLSIFFIFNINLRPDCNIIMELPFFG